MNLLLIFSGIAIAIAAMLGIFAHSRTGAIWFTWAGVVLAITAAFVWFQGTVPKESPVEKTETVNSISHPTTPEAQAASSSLTPGKIWDEINAARPLQRDDIRKTFIGIPVEWRLPFSSASLAPRGDILKIGLAMSSWLLKFQSEAMNTFAVSITASCSESKELLREYMIQER